MLLALGGLSLDTCPGCTHPIHSTVVPATSQWFLEGTTHACRTASACRPALWPMSVAQSLLASPDPWFVQPETTTAPCTPIAGSARLVRQSDQDRIERPTDLRAASTQAWEEWPTEEGPPPDQSRNVHRAEIDSSSCLSAHSTALEMHARSVIQEGLMDPAAARCQSLIFHLGRGTWPAEEGPSSRPAYS